jgi:hypothetical protein
VVDDWKSTEAWKLLKKFAKSGVLLDADPPFLFLSICCLISMGADSTCLVPLSQPLLKDLFQGIVLSCSDMPM